MVTCNQEDCTIESTGICKLNYSSLDECPNVILDPNSDSENDNRKKEEQIIFRFPFGYELGIKDAKSLTRSQYTPLIGIIGFPEAGKTCVLISLYIRLTSNKDGYLNKYKFAGSHTLLGFEKISRFLRIFDNQIPNKISARTSHFSDPRKAGLLHLKIREINNEDNVKDVLFTDIQGEVFDTMLEDNDFLKNFVLFQRCDLIYFCVDSTKLVTNPSRNIEFRKIKLLLLKLYNILNLNKKVKVIFLITKYDLIYINKELDIKELENTIKSKIQEYCNYYEIMSEIRFISAISTSKDIDSGYNMDKIFDDIFYASRFNFEETDLFEKNIQIEKKERNYFKFIYEGESDYAK